MDHEEPDVRLDLIGSSHSYSGFDRFGRVVDQKWYDYGSSSDVDRYKYGYDRASNRLYRENTKTSNKDEYYSYDDVYRLEIADRGNLNTGKTAISGTPVRKLTYNLDPTGNWDAFVIQNSGAFELLQGRTHNEANEIDGGADDFQTTSGTDWANVSHDANGNMTVVPQPNALGSSYDLTFDAWNRLVKVEDGATTVAEYEYDGLNRRITKDVSGTVRHFFYSDQWQVVEERSRFRS